MSSHILPLRVSFLSSAEMQTLSARAGMQSPLLALGFGTDAAPVCEIPLALPGLRVIAQPPLFEVWSSDAPVAYTRDEDFATATTDRLFAGAIALRDTRAAPLETSVFDLYCRLFDLIDKAGYPHLLRLYNYLPDITGIVDGFERYQRFSLGRHDAFMARRRPVTASPATCALGSHDGPVTLAFIAARAPGTALENPRQISAYEYPERYGPRSPTFSRALMAEIAGKPQFFLSGTASIVGHESRHRGDAVAQARETLTNVQTMRREAVEAGLPPDRAMLFKVYLRDAALFDTVSPVIAAGLQPGDRAIFLEADICRPDLLVEIDGASL